MDAEIGLAAGDVYRYLEAHGASSVSQLKKGTGRKDALLNQAIGWLAREDKIVRQADAKAARWALASA